MTAPLPPYSGPAVVCPKCGHGSADTEWQPSNVEISTWGRLLDKGVLSSSAEPGWLLRTCTRCRYLWAEATTDWEVDT